MGPNLIIRRCQQVKEAIALHEAAIAEEEAQLRILQAECGKIGHMDTGPIGQGLDGSPAYRCSRCGAEYEKV